MGGGEGASGPFATAQLAAQQRASLNHEPLGQRAFGFLRFDFDNSHRRQGTKVIRENGFEQALGEARKLSVQLEMNTGGEKGETFQEPFDVGVLAGFLGIEIQREAASDLWKIAAEFGRGLAQVP